MRNRVKLLQLTDLHRTIDDGALQRGKNIARQLTSVVTAATEDPLWPPHLVVVTGDLTDETEPSAMSQVYQLLARQFAQFDTQVCCIPGNHDDAGALARIFTAHGMQIHGSRIELANWCILALDSSQAGSPSGYLDDNGLRWLEQQLTEAADHHVMLLIHHPPVAVGCAWLDKMRLINGRRVLALLRRHPNSRLIISGHVHQAYDALVEGTRILTTPAACPTQFLAMSDQFAVDEQAGAGYRWCELYDDGSVNTEVHRVFS